MASVATPDAVAATPPGVELPGDVPAAEATPQTDAEPAPDTDASDEVKE